MSIEVFRMTGEPDIREKAPNIVSPELQDFPESSLRNIDAVLNQSGRSFDTLNNFFEACKEDNIDTTEFVHKLKFFSEGNSPIELKKLIDEWWAKVF
jgi:hypothetical protein